MDQNPVFVLGIGDYETFLHCVSDKAGILFFFIWIS